MLLGECLTTFAMFAGPLADQAVCEEALAVTRRSGDRTNTAWSHNTLGLRALAADDLKTARQHFGQARAILREIGDLTPEPVADLGWVHLRSGDPAAADSDFAETLRGFAQLHDRLLASYAILALACSAAAQRDWERAARLLGFADHELHNCGRSWNEPEQTYRKQSLADAECHPATEFGRCYDSERADDRSDLIDFALRQQHPLTLPLPELKLGKGRTATTRLPLPGI